MTDRLRGTVATTGRYRRLVGRAILASVAAALLLGLAGTAPMVGPAAAASPDVTMVAAARYTIQPTKHRVHVSVDLRATNYRSDTVIRRYYVDAASLAVLPGTSGFTVAALGSTAHPSVQVSSRTSSQTLLAISLGTKLGSGRTITLRLSFDLVDRGGSATRNVRVGTSFATFPVWAYGSAGTGGGSVSVSLPAGYRMTSQGGSLKGPSTDSAGNQTYTSGSLAAPLTWAAYIVADRAGAYRETPLSPTVAGAPMAVVVRAWPDDAAFGSRIAALEKKALPALGKLIGVPAPGEASPLAIEEAITQALGGYASIYDPGSGRILVAYDAAPGVVLRESAHAWFNQSLVADRWAAEGFAGYYAATIAPTLNVALPATPLTKALQAARIPLNAWTGGGRTPTKSDAYAEAASIQLATLIAKRAGPAGLTAVWQAAASGEMADLSPAGTVTSGATPGAATSGAGSPGAAAAPSSGGAPDWRGLLDLLETRTGQPYDDLWRTWVVRPDEVSLLDDRARVRAAYAAAVAQAGDWQLPASIRTALDEWRFDDASAQIDAARAVLTQRTTLATAAETADLTLPGTLRTAFEGSGGTAAAAAEATAERQAISRIVADSATKPDDSSPVAAIGLLGADPDATLASARTAFAAGDLSGAVATADAAAATWTGAQDVGRGRLAMVALVLAAFGVVAFVATRFRARRAISAGRAIAPLPSLPRRYPPPRSAASWAPMAHRSPAQPTGLADRPVPRDPPSEAAAYGTLPGTLPGASDQASGDEGGDDR